MRLVYDPNLYDEASGKWVASKFKDTEGKPSSWMLYKELNKLIEVQSDKNRFGYGINYSCFPDCGKDLARAFN